MSRKDTRLFNPVRVRSGNKLKTVLTGVAAFILVFLIAGTVYVSKNGSDGAKDIIKKISTVFEFSKRDKTLGKAFKNAKTNILLMSISSEKTEESGEKEIYFMAIAHADASTGQLKFFPIKAKREYLKYYEEGGPDAVTKVVAKEYNIKMEKYIASDENTFALAVNYMGGLQYTVPERVEYRTKDLTLILTPGKQIIKGEVLIKYLKYFKTIDLSKQGEILCVMVKDYFTKENFDDAMKIYKGVLTNLSDNSNISFIETADNLDCVKTIVDNSKKVTTVSSVKEF